MPKRRVLIDERPYRRVPPPESEMLGGARLVHNHYPGSKSDPGLRRGDGLLGFWISSGFRWWVPKAHEEDPVEERCFCGWLDGRKHFSTHGYVDESGVRQRDRFRPPSTRKQRKKLARRAAREVVALRQREAVARSETNDVVR
jgi:hypothetical protein